jgi:hypothetical protein
MWETKALSSRFGGFDSLLTQPGSVPLTPSIGPGQAGACFSL